MPPLKLTAPNEVDQVNVGGNVYDVSKDGTVNASPDDVAALEAAGFVRPADPVVVTGLLTMSCPPGASCSVGGYSFTDDDNDGLIQIPAAGVQDLLSHGFGLVSE